MGIKEQSRIAILNAPSGYQEVLGVLPAGVITVKLPESQLDFIQFFAKERKDLEENFPKLKRSLKSDGTLWISWPKRSSKMESDLNEILYERLVFKIA